jgi:hypothetical protein
MSSVKRILFLTAVFFAVLLPATLLARSGRPQVLDGLKHDTETELARLAGLVEGAASALKGKPLGGDDARKVLKNLCSSAAYIVECATVDMAGRIAAVQPDSRRQNEGADISKQKHAILFAKTGKPVMSGYFTDVGGESVVSLVHPVLGGDGKPAGSVSVIFKPAKMLEPLFSVFKGWCPVDFDVVEGDGMILYGIREGETGKNLLGDPRLAGSRSLQKLWKTIAAQPTGEGEYTIGEETPKGGKPILKEAHWDTVSLAGTEWKLVIIHWIGKAADESMKISYDDQAIRKMSEDLADLARSAELSEAIESSNTPGIKSLLWKFYDKHQFIYSIQYVAPDGGVKAGWPRENSVVNYNFNHRILDGDESFLKALEAKKGKAFTSTLAEGNVGHFILKPVFKGDRFLGIVYAIVLSRTQG